MRYLRAAHEAGVAADVALVGVSVSDANTNQYPITFVDLPSAGTNGMPTGTPGLPDVLIIKLQFPDARVFEFRVVHRHGDLSISARSCSRLDRGSGVTPWRVEGSLPGAWDGNVK